MKHMWSKRVLVCAMTAAMLAGTVAYAEEEHKPVTLTIVHEHNEEAAQNIPSSGGFRYCMELYKESHPWVTLEESYVANSDILNKYTTLIAADELPDITYVKNTWLENMAGTGMLVDLTDYADPDNYYDGLAFTTYEGRVWGLPNKFSAYNLVCYNDALWKEAGYDELPSTFEEFIAADEKFDEMGYDLISLGNSAKWFAVAYFVDSLAYDYCGEEWCDKIIAGDSSVKYTDENFVKVLQVVQDIAPVFNADFNMTDDIAAASMYMQGKSACHVIGSWGISTLKGMSEENPEVWENTRVALIPPAAGSEGYLITACGAALGVSSRLLEEGKEEELQAAIEFCQTISSAEYAQYCADHGATTPYKTEFKWDDMGRPFVEMSQVLSGTPKSGMHFNDAVNDTVKIAIQNETQSLMAGATTPEAAAEAIQAVQEQVYGM